MMSNQGKSILRGAVVYRWYVTVDRKTNKTMVTWAETQQAAKEKAERRGLRVLSVQPAPHRV